MKLLMAKFPGFKSSHFSSIAFAMVVLYVTSIFSKATIQLDAIVSVVTYWTSNFALYDGASYTEKKYQQIVVFRLEYGLVWTYFIVW